MYIIPLKFANTIKSRKEESNKIKRKFLGTKLLYKRICSSVNHSLTYSVTVLLSFFCLLYIFLKERLQIFFCEI